MVLIKTRNTEPEKGNLARATSRMTAGVETLKGAKKKGGGIAPLWELGPRGMHAADAANPALGKN